ncbi:MAG TPA: hypothetical protein VFH53_06095, partial [Phycisphaerae bacterium]|nr:hypothetical protein [Phycisphaerae bacterium]
AAGTVNIVGALTAALDDAGIEAGGTVSIVGAIIVALDDATLEASEAGAGVVTVVERIARALKAALEAVTVANGYTLSVVEVTRPRLSGLGVTPKDLAVSLIQADRQRAAEHDVTGNPPGLGWRLTFRVDLLRRVSEDDETPIDAVLNEFEGQVVKALMADPQWGGLAINTELGDVDYPGPGEAVEGAGLNVLVDCRVAENDPYTRI